MVTATLTSKGQITIPKPIRNMLHLHVGDRVEFVVHDGKEAVLKPITRSVDDVFGKLHRKSTASHTVEEMNEAIRQRMKKP